MVEIDILSLGRKDMGLVRTMGKFCFVQCDWSGCNKKMENNDEKMLVSLAKSCGWLNKGDQWLCPDCKEKSQKAKKK